MAFKFLIARQMCYIADKIEYNVCGEKEAIDWARKHSDRNEAAHWPNTKECERGSALLFFALFKNNPLSFSCNCTCARVCVCEGISF